tara:strand:- start:818 stop:952 length:135 start_codon:yes stop_codon:yes gene_type:complete
MMNKILGLVSISSLEHLITTNNKIDRLRIDKLNILKFMITFKII